ncbi:MAG: SIMPL domain-containing protein [Candidatus Flemingiibacterium sp.]
MKKTITVKGTGSVSAKPDLIILSLTIEKKDVDYEKALRETSDAVKALSGAALSCGHPSDALKTSDFRVRSEYSNVRGEDGAYKQVFAGYVCTCRMKLSFGLDMELLSQTLGSISGCDSQPGIEIAFTIKDRTKINDELLEAAAQNARSKAETLCRASGVRLGKLVSINYDWNSRELVSNTRLEAADCFSAMNKSAAILDGIEPEDISASDSAIFVWRLED